MQNLLKKHKISNLSLKRYLIIRISYFSLKKGTDSKHLCMYKSRSLGRSRGYHLATPLSRAHVCGSRRLCTAKQTSGPVVSNFRGGRREINVRTGTGARDRAFMRAAP